MLTRENKNAVAMIAFHVLCIQVSTATQARGFLISLVFVSLKARAVPPPLPVGRASLVLYKRVPDRTWWQLVALGM